MPDGFLPLPAAAKGAFQGDDIADIVGQCTRRLAEMRTIRSSNFTTWRELSSYIYPTRGRFVQPPISNVGNRGAQVTQNIVDRTGTKAAKDLGSFLMAGITSPARAWFRLGVNDAALNGLAPVRQWLDDVQKRMLRVFAVSNFYAAMASLYEEVAVFGTAAMIVVEDFDTVIRCYPLTAGEYMLAADDRLQVGTLYREYVLTAESMVAQFGAENCSPEVQNLYRSGALGREISICHAIEPNFRRQKGRKDWRGMPYLSIHFEAGRRRDQALRIGGFHQRPFIAPRWDVVTTDVYGHGPGEEALPDVKSLQFLQRRKAEAIDKMVKPPLVGDSALANSVVSLLPGGLNFIPGGSAAGLRPVYTVPPNIQGLLEDIQERQQLIRQAFRTDLIAMFANSDRAQITAREVDERHEEKLLMLGPMLERFHDEALNPIIDMVFGIMLRGKLLPEPPQELAGRYIEPDYISLLAQAQKSIGTTSLERMVGFIGNVAAAVPGVLDKFNADEAVEEYGEYLGVNTKVLRSEDEVGVIRQQREQAAQQQQAAQMGMQAVQGAKVLSETETGGGKNALQMMTGL